MNVSTLIKRLQNIKKKYGDLEIDILTETERTGQVEQPLGSVATTVFYRCNMETGKPSLPGMPGRVKLVPQGF